MSFAALIGQPATSSKKTWAGMVERRKALFDAGICLDELDPVTGALASVDDVLDAGVAAWTALRIARGVAHCFPPQPEHDENGRAIAIWA